MSRRNDRTRPRHRPACPQDRAPIEYIGQHGDLMLRCATCPTTWQPDPTEPRPGRPNPRSRFVCPEHLQPVTPKGVGCPDCQQRPSRPPGPENYREDER